MERKIALKLLFVFGLTWTLAAGCSNQAAPVSQPTSGSDQSAKAIRELSQRLDQLNERVRSQEYLVKNDGAAISSLSYPRISDSTEAMVDCADHGYASTHSLGPSLVLLVVCEDVKSYLSGSRIKLKIGNPNSISFSGLAYTLATGADSGAALQALTGIDSSMQIAGRLTETFRPAYWTTVTITAPNKKPDSFRWVVVRLTADALQLYN